MPEEEIGRISEFFSHVSVAGIDVASGVLRVGDRLHIKGHTTDMETTVASLQINNVNVQEAKPGDSVGVKVPDRVRRGDHVYRIIG
ncbi:MAG: translation elongation factor-like protein [Chloroflexi bacterium]|nr:translation elongation factor-like protein [Chloroflexota bacterium]